MKLCDKLGIENIVADVIICNDAERVEVKISDCEFIGREEPTGELLDAMINDVVDWDDRLKVLYETGEYVAKNYRMMVI